MLHHLSFFSLQRLLLRSEYEYFGNITSDLSFINHYVKEAPNGRMTPLAGFNPNYKYIVDNSYFYDLRTLASGGAINLEYVSSDLRCVELSLHKSTFFNCSGYHGGAVYFYSPSKGNFSIYSICVSKCFTTSASYLGMFMYAYMYSEYNSICDQMSLSECIMSDGSNRNCSIYLNFGKVYFFRSNISKNTLYRQASGIEFFNIIEHNLTLCTFSHNSAQVAVLSFFGNTTIQYCNIVYNNHTISTTGVIMASQGTTTLSYNVIFGNYRTPFYSITPGILNVLKNSITHNNIYGISRGPSVVLSLDNSLLYVNFPSNTEYSYGLTNTYSLVHFNSYHCPTMESIEGLDLTPCQTMPPECPTIQHQSSLDFISVITLLQTLFIIQI